MTILDKISEIINKIGQGSTSANQPTPKYYSWYDGQEDFDVSNEHGGKVIFDFQGDRQAELTQSFGAITVDGVVLRDRDSMWTCPHRFEIEFAKTFTYTGTSYSSRWPTPFITVIYYK